MVVLEVKGGEGEGGGVCGAVEICSVCAAVVAPFVTPTTFFPSLLHTLPPPLLPPLKAQYTQCFNSSRAW